MKTRKGVRERREGERIGKNLDGKDTGTKRSEEREKLNKEKRK